MHINMGMSNVDHYTWIFTSRIFRLALEITFLTSTLNCVFLLTFLRIWKLQGNNWKGFVFAPLSLDPSSVGLKEVIDRMF